MTTAGRETWLLFFGSLFGALISRTIDILLSDFGNTWNWIVFFVVMAVIWFIAYQSLKFFNAKKQS